MIIFVEKYDTLEKYKAQKDPMEKLNYQATTMAIPHFLHRLKIAKDGCVAFIVKDAEGNIRKSVVK